MVELAPERAVVLRQAIGPEVAAAAVGRIIDLSRAGRDDVFLCIDCAGGDVKAGLAIYDAIQLAPCDVVTLCFGAAGSMAALLLAAGAPGKRHAVPQARIVIHDPVLLVQGVGPEAEVALMVQLKGTVDAIMLRHAGRTWSQLRQAQGAAPHLDAATALGLGVIDDAALEVRLTRLRREE
jgi:ATP-dependent Clp protease, protease subunit